MRTSKTGLLVLFLVLGMLTCVMAPMPTAAAHEALPYPNAATPQAVDRGALRELSGTTPISVTVALRLSDPDGAEKLLTALNTPGNPQFRQYLTAEAFAARFAPAEADVAKVVQALSNYGLTAERTTATTLKVTGLPADFERAFAVSLHSYEVPAHDNVAGYTFRAPVARATIPAEISGSVAAVVGLDTRPHLRPHFAAAPPALPRPQTPAPAIAPGNPPGFWTVTDFVNYYDVYPLYNRAGVSGSGRTLGIMTLASFTPSDAFYYWNALGLSVDPNRIQIVDVDGGPGAPSDASGSIETTLDVEQSGGIAPGANIIVYQAPNTSQGFVDLFAAAVEANSAQTLSISWGGWEWFDNLGNGPVIDPLSGLTAATTQAVHELLVRAGVQGQTVIAAAGDGGAYDVNNDLGCDGPYSSSDPFSCSLTLSVDYPASDPAITAAGGTTLPGVQTYCLNGCASLYTIDIPVERAWSWDYLTGLCKKLGYSPIACGIFPIGGGGGVSIMFAAPSYQNKVTGVERSQPGQLFQAGSFFEIFDVGLYYALPAGYPGRNVPDISANADPDTGYLIVYTSSVDGFGIATYYGGTSFVAPQLNGVSALLGQYLHNSRIGLLNNGMYSLMKAKSGKLGSPFHTINSGDNWFYTGRNGYSPAVGIGTLNVWIFAESLSSQQ